MKFVLYTENHVPGGGNRYLTDFVSAIDPSHSVTLVSNKGGLFENDLCRILRNFNYVELDVINMWQRLHDCTIPLYRIILKVFWRFSLSRNMIVRRMSHSNKKLFIEYLNENAFDYAIAFNGGFPAALSCFDFLDCASKVGALTTMSVVSMPTEPSFIENIYYKTILVIDRYLVNCEAIKITLASSRGIPQQKIQVIYNCTDIPAIPNNLEITEERTLRYGFVGRAEKLKGADLLVESFYRAMNLKNNIKLTIYGKNMLSESSQKIIRKSVGRIILNGPFDNSSSDVYPNIDVLILPSFWEGFPYVIIEAMSFGIPVIATNVGGISEVLISGDNGYLIEPRNAEQLIKTILYSNQNRSQLFILSQKARYTAENRFTKTIFNENVNIFISTL